MVKGPLSGQESLDSNFHLNIFPGFGYAAFQVFGYGLKDGFFTFLNIRLPRMQDFFHEWRLLPGSASLREVLANKFGIVFDPFKDIDSYRRILPIIAGLMVGIVFLLIILMIQRWLEKNFIIDMAMGTLVLSSFWFSPSCWRRHHYSAECIMFMIVSQIPFMETSRLGNIWPKSSQQVVMFIGRAMKERPPFYMFPISSCCQDRYMVSGASALPVIRIRY